MFVCIRTWATRINIGMKRVSCAICVAFPWWTSSLARKPTRFIVAIAMMLNLHHVVMVAVKFSVLVSLIFIIPWFIPINNLIKLYKSVHKKTDLQRVSQCHENQTFPKKVNHNNTLWSRIKIINGFNSAAISKNRTLNIIIFIFPRFQLV